MRDTEPWDVEGRDEWKTFISAEVPRVIRLVHPTPVHSGLGSGSLSGSEGFTYVTVLILVAIMGAGLGAIGTVWHHVAQREKERELLFVGGEYRRAIGSYIEHTPLGGAAQYPRKLEDLILDTRVPFVRRHLRKEYIDPMTGTHDWGLVKEPRGGIVGVHSQATGTPVKSAKFRQEDEAFAAAETYADWKFVYGFGTSAGAGGTPPGTAGALQFRMMGPDGKVRWVAVAPRGGPSVKDDPARKATRQPCEGQRRNAAGECNAKGSAETQDR